jgi:hypothetical protein
MSCTPRLWSLCGLLAFKEDLGYLFRPAPLAFWRIAERASTVGCITWIMPLRGSVQMIVRVRLEIYRDRNYGHDYRSIGE